MIAWLVVAGAALATYLIRISMVVVFDRRALPASLEPVLELATPAVLAAVVAGTVLLVDGAPQVPSPATLAALGATVVVVRRTGRSSLALAVGLPIAGAAVLAGLG